MKIKSFLAIFVSLILILYCIHDYLYLPNGALDAISIHLEKIYNTIRGIHMISMPLHEQVYDKTHILSMTSLIFALFWTTIIFISIGIIIGYLFLMIYAKGSDKKLFFNILLYTLIFFVIYVILLCYTICIHPPIYLKAYFVDPFKLDLAFSGNYYNSISERFHEELLSLLWQNLNISKWWYVGISILYLLFHIAKIYQKKISNKKLQQQEQAKQEREVCIDADNNRIIKELKEYESEEHRQQLARHQAKEKAEQEQIRAMKEAKLLQLQAKKLKEEQARIQVENARSQENAPTDLQDTKESTNQDIDDFISVNEVGENYTII